MMAAGGQTEVYPTRLEIRSVRHIPYVETEEINWIEAADNYVILHTISGSHLMRESMSSLEARLDPEKFLRIHRCPNERLVYPLIFLLSLENNTSAPKLS
jgi:two-component system, LytTR family, response regulator